jgi:hypothetical protein
MEIVVVVEPPRKASRTTSSERGASSGPRKPRLLIEIESVARPAIGIESPVSGSCVNS